MEKCFLFPSNHDLPSSSWKLGKLFDLLLKKAVLCIMPCSQLGFELFTGGMVQTIWILAFCGQEGIYLT